MGLFAAEGETLGQAVLRKQLLGGADAFGDTSAVGEDADNVGTAGDPDDNLVVSLEEMAGAVDVEKLRVQRTFEEIER